MQAPPTRYKVVERGRRLEVIDTWTGQAATRPPRPVEQAPRRAASAPVARTRPAPLTQRGQRILRTAAWYDAKGPREIVLGQAAEGKLKAAQIGLGIAAVVGGIIAFNFWPLVFVAVFTLGRRAVRDQLRTAATAFLDSLAQPASRG